ncbi:MAG: RuvB-like domain-containing protein [Desulfurococcales archaeon]|nr:RuvB-like domain-containing protein [Desulfurococcales archaeon]
MPEESLPVSSIVRSFAWTHSHIRGLGLDENGRAKKIADGLVGQEEAREAAGIIVELVKRGKFSGRGVLIVGPPGTGKTAIAIAMAKELGEHTPFVALNAAEIYSLEKKKTEVLMQAIRRAIGVRVRERRRVYEGVVTKLEPITSGYYLEGAIVKLETSDDERELTVGPEIAEQLLALRIRPGDHILIDAETGAVQLLGRVKSKLKRRYDIDFLAVEQMPSGPILKTREVVHVFTLHDLDIRFAGYEARLKSFFGLFAFEREITEDARKQTDSFVKKLLDEGRGELLPGVLFIDDAHLLDLEAFSFLTKAMEAEFSPIIVLATNRGMTKIRGTDIESPHGIPRDLLDRLLIIVTRPYTEEEIRAIISIRAEEEEIPLSDDALEELTRIGASKSLRYALQLLIPAHIIALRRGSTKVGVNDVREAERLFSDIKRSIDLINKYGELMLR